MSQTLQLSKVLDTLLEQESSGKDQDATSLNSLLNAVLPSYVGPPGSRDTLTADEVDVVLKIFQALRLLLSRSPSLIVENNTYSKLLHAIKIFYDSSRFPPQLSDSANLTLVQIISAAFNGGKLRNNRYLLVIRDDLINTLEQNLKDVLRSLVSNDNPAEASVTVYASEIADANDRKFAKLSVSIRILQVLMDQQLSNVFMLHMQYSMYLDNFIRRTWFCIDNMVINMDLTDDNANNYLSQTSVPSIASKFDQLYSILLSSTVGHFSNDDEHLLSHLEQSLSQCKQLLNWVLLPKFPALQVVLSESLMVLLLRCNEIDNLAYYWHRIDITASGHTRTDLHHDLLITLNLLLDIYMTHKSKPVGKRVVSSATTKYVNQRLNSTRQRVLWSFALDQSMRIDHALVLTDGHDPVHLGNYSHSAVMNTLGTKKRKAKRVPPSTSDQLRNWIDALQQLLKGNPTKVMGTAIGRLYLSRALGIYACIAKGTYDTKTGTCSICDSADGQPDRNRSAITDDPESLGYNLAFATLMELFVNDPTTLQDPNLALTTLLSICRFCRSYRPPPLTKIPKLWNFLQECFTSPVRELRVMTAKTIPLILFSPEDDEYDSNFDSILKMLNSLKLGKDTAYLYEGIIMTWGGLLAVAKLDHRFYVLLNPLIQFLGDNDEFRSNLALHELRIVASEKNMTPWKLVEPFIPLISCDLVEKRNTHPGMLDNFCQCIRMDGVAFLRRTQEFTVPRFVQSFDNEHIGFLAKQLKKTRTELVEDNLEKSLALLLTTEDPISPQKTMRILSIFNPAYKKMKLETVLDDAKVLNLFWELLCLYNCTDVIKKRIYNALILVCISRRGSARGIDSDEDRQNLLDVNMNIGVLGIAQTFSAIIHDHKGSNPFLEKVQAIRAIRCLTELTKSFEASVTQIMTCLQFSMEFEELQYESLECLKVITVNLSYEQLSIVVDLIISYLLQKCTSFTQKCRSITRDILSIIFEKDSNIIKEHPSYVYSLSTSEPDLSRILNTTVRTPKILLEFTRRLKADNMWVILQVLDDMSHFFDIRQIDLQQQMLTDDRISGVFSSLISNLMTASNRFSTTTDIPKKCSRVLSEIGALDISKFGSFFHRNTGKLVLVSNLSKDHEVAEFSVYFLNNILVKCFVASTDPVKQLVLAYTMQEHLKILDITAAKLRDTESPEHLLWSKLSKLSQTVLKPLLVSRYTRGATNEHVPLVYPTYKSKTKHSKWLTDLTEDMLYRAVATRKIPKTARSIFSNCTAMIKDQDLSISEFLLPYVTLMLIVYGDDNVHADIEIEIDFVLSQDLESISNDTVMESLKSCYRTVFSIVDYFREWASERKRDKRYHRSSTSIEERHRVEHFLLCLPTEMLAKRTAQCNSYERAIFNLEQSYKEDKMSKNEFFDTIRHMYAEVNDTDALEGVLKKFSTDTLNDKLLQFQYSDDWQVTHESLTAIAEDDDETDRPAHVASLLKSLDDHCEYDKVVLELRNYDRLTEGAIDSKDLYICGLQASIFTGQLVELVKWVRQAENTTSIMSPGSDLSIYYEFAQGLISLHDNDLESCKRHIDNASTNVGLALAVSREISHTKVADYMIILHCLFDFGLMTGIQPGQACGSVLQVLQQRQDNTNKDFRTRWKIHSLHKAIEKLHPLETVQNALGNTLVQSSQILREAGRLDLATRNITYALKLGTYNPTVNFEFAKLLWAQGDHRQALKTLRNQIDEDTENRSPEMQLKYTQWLEYSANGSSDEIIRGYRAAAASKNIEDCGKAQYYLGRYYNKLLDACAIDTPGLKRLEKDFYGDLEYNVIKAYMRSASFSNEFLFEVLPKAVTVWLDYGSKLMNPKKLKRYSSETVMAKRRDNYSSILKFVKACAKDEVSTYKWFTVLSQLTSRMVYGDSETEAIILKIIVELAKKYPEVILYSVYAQVQSKSVDRRQKGKEICQMLKNGDDSALSKQLVSAFELLEALKGICEAKPGKTVRGKLRLWEDLKFSYKKGTECQALALPTRENFDKLHSPLAISTRRAGSHKIDNFITILRFDSTVTILNSMQKPRKLYVIGTNRKRYSILCKPNDDLRKDAKLMEFATVMDHLLQTDFESEKRSLSITSYAVVPLNESMGLIEMVDDVRTIRDIMLEYLQWQGTRFDYAKVKDLLGDSTMPLEEKLVNYNKLKKLYKPVLQIWFADKFANPVVWYTARNRYTRSCAVMSIVGYLLGMGDRHGDNVLLNEKTGQILHVDFDCLFDKGKKLLVPERVPFRLTQNMVAAMGVNEYEGTFRRACEVTMRLIKQNENTLMNILETFLYDPILDWKKSSKKHKTDHNLDAKADLQPQVAMDTIRRKIKGILDPRDLDTGAKDSGGLSVSVSAQVDAVIQQATSDENLAQMYVGWMAFL